MFIYIITDLQKTINKMALTLYETDANLAPTLTGTGDFEQTLEKTLLTEEVNIRSIFERFKRIPVVERIRHVEREDRENIAFEHNHPLTHETLIDISRYGLDGINYYYARFPEEAKIFSLRPNVYLRESIAKSLVKVDHFLRMQGMHIYIRDGWRSLTTQRYARYWFIMNAMNNATNDGDKRSKELKPQENMDIINRAMTCYSDPDPTAPHISGGAFDAEIWDIRTKRSIPFKPWQNFNNGKRLGRSEAEKILSPEESRLYHWFNSNHYRDKDTGEVHQDGFSFNAIEQFLKNNRKTPNGVSRQIYDSIIEIANNRRMLYHLLTQPVEKGGFLLDHETFTVLPSEYWHYGRGDRTSSCLDGTNAYYNPVHVPINGSGLLNAAEDGTIRVNYLDNLRGIYHEVIELIKGNHDSLNLNKLKTDLLEEMRRLEQVY